MPPLTLRDRIDQTVFNAIYARSLVYNTCWEDPAVDRLALALGPVDTLLVITSAGCNVLDHHEPARGALRPAPPGPGPAPPGGRGLHPGGHRLCLPPAPGRDQLLLVGLHPRGVFAGLLPRVPQTGQLRGPQSGAGTRIVPHTSTLTEFLQGRDERISRFVLLDHMDWMSSYYPAALVEEWDEILAHATGPAAAG